MSWGLPSLGPHVHPPCNSEGEGEVFHPSSVPDPESGGEDNRLKEARNSLFFQVFRCTGIWQPCRFAVTKVVLELFTWGRFSSQVEAWGLGPLFWL